MFKLNMTFDIFSGRKTLQVLSQLQRLRIVAHKQNFKIPPQSPPITKRITLSKRGIAQERSGGGEEGEGGMHIVTLTDSMANRCGQ